MNTKRIVLTSASVLLAAVLVVFALLFAHLIGNTPASTVDHDGGAWDTGANGGRAWSSYEHPTQWHFAEVQGHGTSRSECVAPGQVARMTVAQSWIGRNHFDAGVCEPPAAVSP
ncbi:lactococcin 972 family bacteriocin [Corynebacterium liangguodongii]|uniref:Uncharacterized protein n=1 Tax=Corynebacterium liangguodongii TaxID=2079535 RepID=A0A2S0WCI3_9CORY|nr:lactococcin 972 family bacteriocin [Corynebacterium liangguodongii]AWB83466.1 hypothetical protein C3E79_02320 [Corynebacterium liangguodongii]PWC00445.1 hypothetical protein DF219_00635 [Corynebacterium liangguodongii]